MRLLCAVWGHQWAFLKKENGKRYQFCTCCHDVRSFVEED